MKIRFLGFVLALSLMFSFAITVHAELGDDPNMAIASFDLGDDPMCD